MTKDKPHIRLVLQARLSSSRLPAKMLLPLAGMEMITLCAKRVKSAGNSFVVATSDQSSDDLLVQTLENNNISFVRGDLDNVYSRFIEAGSDLDDGDLLVRLTGDNPFVDASFIEDLIECHFKGGKDYTRTLSPQDGFPYGLSAEIFTVGALRAVDDGSLTDAHKEHVTLALAEKGDYELFENATSEDLSELRVTVDTFDDYVRAAQTFDLVDDWNASWQSLIKKLKTLPDITKEKVPLKIKGKKFFGHMALGTVQFGLSYGIANKQGQPNNTLAKEIVHEAIRSGVTLLDTASAYGTSESVLGSVVPKDVKDTIQITTKLDPLSNLLEEASDELIISCVESSVYQSLHRLGLKKLPVLMLHRWAHYSSHSGAVIKTLQRLQGAGVIETIGASVQSVEEGIEALNAPEIEFIQLPFNILDQRWRGGSFVEALQKNSSKYIQVRSCLLQGLLTLPSGEWPKQQSQHADKIGALFEEYKNKFKRSDITDLCMAYVRSQSWVDTIVVGVDNVEQLKNNIRYFNTPLLSEDELQLIENTMPDLPETLLNPSLWEA